MAVVPYQRIIRLSLLAATLTSTMLTACSPPSEKSSAAAYRLQGDTIVVAAGSRLAAKLKTGVVQPDSFREQLTTAATVKAIPTQYAEIAPLFKGRITRSALRLGMAVQPGTILFEISSPDYSAAQKTFFQEKSQLEQARKNLLRQQDLHAHGVGVQKDLEEAQTAYAVEQQEYGQAAAALRLFHTDPDHMILGQALPVRSPIAGEVIENKVVPGQLLNDDAAGIAIVADLSKVWIAGQVKEKDLHLLETLKSCTIEIPAYPGKQLPGKLYHVSPVVDEATRSVAVLIEAGNADRSLKPGMYVTASFSDAAVPALLVPSGAILQLNDSSFVFVEAAPGRYLRRKVVTGTEVGGRILIREGLTAGEHILTQGGFYLLDTP